MPNTHTDVGCRENLRKKCLFLGFWWCSKATQRTSETELAARNSSLWLCSCLPDSFHIGRRRTVSCTSLCQCPCIHLTFPAGKKLDTTLTKARVCHFDSSHQINITLLGSKENKTFFFFFTTIKAEVLSSFPG